jgi:L-threonylcarbamoyladenylate synthase
MILDGGPTQVGIESTVVALTRERPAVLRPGMISQADLEAATNVVWKSETASRDLRESPGMHPRHYAPRTPFYVLEPGERRPAGNGRVIDLPQNPLAYAAALYAELHKADTEGWDWIAVERPPDMPEWAGILDRIQRAATRRA